MKRNERGAVPVIVIYAILLAMAFGGLAGLTAYLASESVASFTLAVALALVLIFSIPIFPSIIHGVVGIRKAIYKWFNAMNKELKK